MFRIKDITALCPLQRVPSWYFFQMDQISLFRVNVLRRDLCFPSQIFHSIIRYSVPFPYIFPLSYYNRNQILNFFMNMVQIFGVITEDFTINDSKRGTKVPPIMRFDGRIYFAVSSFSFKFVQYLPGIYFSILSIVILVSINPRGKICLICQV